MSIKKYINAKDWRVELIYDGASYGLFNLGELSHGSESGEIIDPEDGHQPLPGRKTTDDVELSRPWRAGRETVQYPVLRGLRTTGSGQILVHEKDPDTGQPASSTPIEVLDVKLISAAHSGSSADGSDATTVTYGFSVRAV